MPAEITTIIDGEPRDHVMVSPGLGTRFTIFDAKGKEGAAVVACHEEDRETDIMLLMRRYPPIQMTWRY